MSGCDHVVFGGLNDGMRESAIERMLTSKQAVSDLTGWTENNACPDCGERLIDDEKEQDNDGM